MYLEFKDEMLIPSINGDVYFQIYELENWFRRICLTAYMKEFGADWLTHIPRPILNSFRSKFNKSQELLHLDIRGDDNLIWMSTHGELMSLLTLDAVSTQVTSLTGFTQVSLTQKLDDLRHVRNFMAHNRALPGTTLTVVKGIIVSLMQGVQCFKDQILYPKSNQVLMGKFSSATEASGFFDNEISDYFVEGWINEYSQQQVYVSFYSDLYALVCLPVDREAIYPGASRLLEAYAGVLENVLAFTINKTGTEYGVLIPKAVPENAIKRVIDVFLPERRVWIDIDFEHQNPKYICNPKIWFYENQRPLEE